jgi:hypothetical protein
LYTRTLKPNPNSEITSSGVSVKISVPKKFIPAVQAAMRLMSLCRSTKERPSRISGRSGRRPAGATRTAESRVRARNNAESR